MLNNLEIIHKNDTDSIKKTILANRIENEIINLYLNQK